MTALTLLRDSFREAIDSKMLAILLMFSTVLILFVGSIGYHPLPAEDVLRGMTSEFYAVRARQGMDSTSKGFGGEFSLKDFTEVEQAAHPGHGSYRFTMISKELNDRNFAEMLAYWKSDRISLPDGPRRQPRPSKELNKEAPELLGTDIEDYFRISMRQKLGLSLKEITRLPDPAPGQKAWSITTGPSDDFRGWAHTPRLLFGAVELKSLKVPLGKILFFVEDTVINGLGAGFAVIIGIIVTAFFVPNMMRKGSLELLLSKPLGRLSILLYKYLGGLIFMLVLTTFTVGGIWLVLGLQSGIWSPNFLWVIPLLTFSFGVLYAVSVLVSVTTRSAVVSILVTTVFAGVLWGTGTLWKTIDALHKVTPEDIPEWLHRGADIAHTILPRTKDLDTITTKLIADGTQSEQARAEMGENLFSLPPWDKTLGVSLAWIVLCLGLASWRFCKRDF